MYPNLLGNSELIVYDLIGMLGYAFILVYFFLKRNRPTWGQALLLMVVHLVTYTFAGKLLAEVLPGRSTEFFGYIGLSGVATVLAAVALGVSPLGQLDRTVPLYLTLASVLKFSCFCAGCCHGYPWAYGLYNHQTRQTEFPTQLLEAMLYALLLVALMRYKGRPGRRYALFLTGYAGVRFAVQFVRADQPVFSLFHWVSAGFLLFGAVCLLLSYLLPTKETCP